MAPKRRVSTLENEDPEFKRDEARVADAMALFARISCYPSAPQSEGGDSVTAALASSRELVAYEAQRAIDIGTLFEPPCQKCGVKKDCLIDVSTLTGRRRTFRCQSCIVGKIACSNADRAVAANASWRRFLAMGQGRGDLGREWKERVTAQEDRARAQKQARLNRQGLAEDKRSDQVSFREVPYAV